MKQFSIKLAPLKLHNGEIVLRTETVTADYFRIEAGALIFRNVAHGNQYPEAVHVFAAGVWTEVEPDHVGM